MATRTTNYGLYKPDPTDDYVDFLSEFNDNMDEIDENLGGGGGGSYAAGDGIDITSNTISVDTAFTEASTRTNINSGDTFSTILGKIKKWFTDLPSMFVSKSGDTMSGNLTLGDTTRGQLNIKGNDPTYSTRIYNSSVDSLTANRNITLPNKSGTLAVTSDIPDISTKVSKSGDTMTGTLVTETRIEAHGTGYYDSFRAGTNSNVGRISLYNGANNNTVTTISAKSGLTSAIDVTLPSGNGTLALDGDPQPTECPRTTSANLNNLPQQSRTVFTEVNPNSTNLPDSFWYHVMTIQGSDTGYATQIAIGMTTSKVWYRRKDNGSWQAWTRII